MSSVYSVFSEDIKKLRKKSSEFEVDAQRIWEQIEQLKDEMLDELSNLVQATEGSVFDIEMFKECLEEFLTRPYAVIPVSDSEWYLVVPKWVRLNYGWLIMQDGIFNIYRVSRTIDLIQPIPQQIKDELDMSRLFDGLVIDDGFLTVEHPEIDDLSQVKKRYSKYLTTIDKKKNRIRVRKDQEFLLIAALIRDGILPFKAKPVSKKHLQDRHCSFTLREYQQRDFEEWLRLGSVGIFYPPQQGKTIVALEAMSVLDGKKLVVVPSKLLKSQWEKRIREHTDLSEDEWEIVIYDGRNLAKIRNNTYRLIIYDEVSTLVSDTHFGFITIQRDYSLFLTATPMREDDREDLVLACTGKPLGVDWTYFLERGLISQPEITVHIVPDQKAKYDKLNELYDPDKKTVIFSDRIKIGSIAAKQHSIPFIHGKTPDSQRMDIIENNDHFVMSRVGDLGISIEGLRMIIEIDFLYGSRLQALQRTGRLFIEEETGFHHIIMTLNEYRRHKKRLFGYFSKGFKVRREKAEGLELISLHDDGKAGGSALSAPPDKGFSWTPRKADIEMATKVPLALKSTVDKKLIKEILSSSFAKEKQGLTTAEITSIIKGNHIRPDEKWTIGNTVHYMFRDNEIQAWMDGKKKRYFIKGGK